MGRERPGDWRADAPNQWPTLPIPAPARGTLNSAPVSQLECRPLSVETWSIIGTVLGTGAVVLAGLVGLMLKLWSDTNRRLEHLEVGLRSEISDVRAELRGEIYAVRSEVSASTERLNDRQRADANAINARLDVLLLARGSLADPSAAAPPPSAEPEPTPAAERTPA